MGMSDENRNQSKNRYDNEHDISLKINLTDNKNPLLNMNNEKKNLTMECYCKHIDGFSGPYRGKYLAGYAPQYKGKKFKNTDNILKVLKKDNFSNGITLTRDGKYTIRRGKELKDSKINKNGSTEISWIYEGNKFQKEKDIKKIKCEMITLKNKKYFIDNLNYKMYNMDKKFI